MRTRRKPVENLRNKGLANPKQKSIKEASGKQPQELDPKRKPKRQRESQEELSPEPRKKKDDSRVGTSKESFKRVRDDIEKTDVTDSQVDDVPPSDADASDGSEGEVQTSDSESVDSSHTLGNEEQTSIKKTNHHPSNQNVMLWKSSDRKSTRLNSSHT